MRRTAISEDGQLETGGTDRLAQLRHILESHVIKPKLRWEPSFTNPVTSKGCTTLHSKKYGPRRFFQLIWPNGKLIK
ncbi:hypothetical protein AYI68_g40 [Smittium mucronatum]|uniref:Uncharacterized protein n=1 Tax=Smittium mucronatum TaxID=133383 RepID=A0A1R0H9I2_9FUNG|nr:hypothetical protein AYI68_g40 [Smittium mucronatum]